VRRRDAVLIRGSGIDAADFAPADGSVGAPIVTLVARMLWDKGVGEFVAAARRLRDQGVRARFWLVGPTDPGNRACIPEAQLHAWRQEGVIEWLGYRNDVPTILAHSQIACLPSYREGLPRSLLEAMAAALPIVATDVPGCREAVRHGENGLLVGPGDSDALATALRSLIEDPQLRRRLGSAGRRRAESEFASSLVVAQTLALYAGVRAQEAAPTPDRAIDVPIVAAAEAAPPL
jgi:glycosyltransferase involved in cell wall biosynthesis